MHELHRKRRVQGSVAGEAPLTEIAISITSTYGRDGKLDLAADDAVLAAAKPVPCLLE